MSFPHTSWAGLRNRNSDAVFAAEIRLRSNHGVKTGHSMHRAEDQSNPAAPGSDDTQQKRLQFADIELDMMSHTVRRGNKRIRLGPTEFQLLHFFMRNPTRVWSRGELISELRPTGTLQPRAVDQYVLRLRRALNAHGGKNLIRTVRHVGYSLDYAY